MKSPVNILILEDSKYDAELLSREINKVTIPYQTKVVATEKEFIEQLRTFKPDLIFADFNLPGFDGARAFDLYKECYSQKIPFIIVSGTIGEEKVVELLHAGATDFVLKSHLHRVPMVLKRALNEFDESRKRSEAENSLKVANRALEILSRGNEAMIRINDEQTLVQNICNIIADSNGHFFAWVGYAENDEKKTIRPVASAGLSKKYLNNMDFRWDTSSLGNGPAGMAIKTQKHYLIRNILLDKNFEPWKNEAKKAGITSALSLPLIIHGKESLGVLSIYTSDLSLFNDQEVNLLKKLGANLSYGITNLRNNIDRIRKHQELLKEQKLLSLLQLISFSINESESIHEALEKTIYQICEYYKWSVGHVYQISYGNPALMQPTDTWYMHNPDRYRNLRRITMQTKFRAGEGVIGRVMTREKPEWIKNLRNSRVFNRNFDEISSEVTSMLCFPIKVNNKVVVILEFFSNKSKEPDLDLMNILEAISTQLGQVYKRYQIQLSLIESEEKYRELIEQAADGIFLFDSDGKIIEMNSKATEITGYELKELVGLYINDLMLTKDIKKKPLNLHSLLTQRSTICEQRIVHKSGKIIYTEISVRLLSNNKIQGIIRDVTERVIAKKKLQKSLKEKEVLLTEIHHRVKNNLAVISGLLDLRASTTTDPNTLALLKDSQSRIKTMALVHESLYKFESLSDIRLDHYIQELLKSIQVTFHIEQTNVDIITQLKPVELTIKQAVPFGMLLNEIITNSFKHAFINRSKGTITINLLNSDDNVKLTISDDGIGLPKDTEIHNPKSLGLTLIQTLIKQLKADMKLNNCNGTTYKISFGLDR